MLGLLFGQIRGATTAAEIERRAAGAVIAGRNLARSSARSVVLSDLMALGATPGGFGAILDVAASDAARAARAARSLGDRAVRLLRGGESASSVRRALTPALELVAATENADAYNGERGRVADGAGTVTQILKVWDAVLDKRTCSVCRGLDGTIVALGESFGLEQPAHPRCRCTFTLLRSDEADGATLIAPIRRIA